MKDLIGTPLRSLPVAGLSRVADLVYFDGPLLTEFVHPHGDRYLRYWCDCDDNANRWMLFRVAESSILRLVSRMVPLDYVIPDGCQDDFVYVIDIASSGKHLQSLLVAVSDIPEDYAPKKGVYIEADRGEDVDTYPVLIEGGWSTFDLLSFPKRFEQAYAFLYATNVLGQALESFPWRGGFSTMHFDAWVASMIPFEHRLGVEALHYSSPGFMRFSLQRSTADQVTESVNASTSARPAYKELSDYIRRNRLNDITDPNSTEWNEHNPHLESKTWDLLQCFGALEWRSLSATASRVFEAAQVARWFYRRVAEIASMSNKGMLRLPQPRQQS